jgi:hypothetical protein
MILRTFAAFGLLLLLTNCAFVDQDVQIAYTPTGAATVDGDKLLVAPTTTNAPAAKNEAGKLVVGSVKNGYGMHTADVLLEPGAVDKIADALAAELEATGYSVVRGDVGAAPAASDTPAVRLTVTRLVVDQIPGAFTVTASAAVGFEIAIEQDGREIDRFLVDSGNEDEALVSGAESKQAALTAALEEAITKAVTMIQASLETGTS